MKKVIFAIVAIAITANALEIKPCKLPPLDDQVFKNGSWVVQ